MNRLMSESSNFAKIRWSRRLVFVCIVCVLSIVISACGTDAGTPTARLNVNIFGWGPDRDGQVGFIQGLPHYPTARLLRVKLVDVANKRVLRTAEHPVHSNRGTLPAVEFGEGLRLEVEVVDDLGEVVASGSTPTFSFQADRGRVAFRLMVMPVNSFAPAGNIVIDSATQELRLTQSRFDSRGYSSSDSDAVWLGRIGHVAVPTDDGRVLIVGGADVSGDVVPGSVPSITRVHDDIQIYDPATGYFTELSLENDAQGNLARLSDSRLNRPRAFHTVTPLGNDRFLVIGGFTLRNEEVRALNTMEIIDLNAPGAQWVQDFQTPDGTPVMLQELRAYHTATLLADGRVVVAGGMGHDGTGSVRQSFEVIDVNQGLNLLGSVSMVQARVEHSAVLSADGQSIWLLGGRNAAGVLASTEIIEVQEEQALSRASVPMNQERFAMSALALEASRGEQVLIVGGFTAVNGEPTSTYELGDFQRESFFTQGDWRLNVARGGAVALELPNSYDVLVFGGKNSQGEILASTERLFFEGLSTDIPYRAEDNMGHFVETRYGASASQLSNGLILMAGGTGGGASSTIDSAELYNPFNHVR